MKNLLRAAIAFGLCAASVGAFAAEPSCRSPSGMGIQLLGSGGPISDDARASSGEVVWIDGKSRLLIDAGGGTYLRFGQSGARLEDLRFIGISHFHTDHSADLPAILKGAYFMTMDNKIALVGPDGSDAFPSMTAFFKDMFGGKTGSFAYLEGLKDGSDGLRLTVSPVLDVDRHAEKAALVYQDAEVKVYAYGIPHGDVPTLAFRIEGKRGTIVVSADQNGSRQGFIDFAKGADILVMPAAIDEDADTASKFLHAPPSIVGKLAAAINPKLLVLNHFMGKSLKDKDGNVKIIQQYYHGPVAEGRDLSCFEVPAGP
ncbi:MBL fold metallo-hydrolase [Xanthomonas sp. NCPPB 2632]|uniref:MBL fold metallo-hydrolase n=1 Tax=Xanthomonas sp. NCPPB 2632 TaxID=3240912 RepID=UPI0035152E8E